LGKVKATGELDRVIEVGGVYKSQTAINVDAVSPLPSSDVSKAMIMV
jgi:hypothetical protein